MNDYSSLKKKTNHRTLPAAVSLLLCVALSTSMLFSRLVSWLPADRQHYIPLTVGNGITSVVTGQRSADGGIRFGAPKAGPVVLAASPFLTQSWFETYDENTVWKGETDIEIFRMSYENGQGQVTVNSMDGDKLLAPGTVLTREQIIDYGGILNLTGSWQMKELNNTVSFYVNRTLGEIGGEKAHHLLHTTYVKRGLYK